MNIVTFMRIICAYNILWQNVKRNLFFEKNPQVTLDEKPSSGKSRFRLSDKFKRALTDIFYQVSRYILS